MKLSEIKKKIIETRNDKYDPKEPDYWEMLYEVMDKALREENILDRKLESIDDYGSIYVTTIVKYEGEIFSIAHNLSSWQDDNSLGDFDIKNDLVQVVPVQRMVTVYEELEE